VKQVEVTIMGHGYVLTCPDGGESLLTQAVATVDKEMSNIRDSGKVKARERIAVLAALNVAYLLAERESQLPTAAARVPAPNHIATGEGELPAAEIDALIRRVDAVLGADGQLL